MTNCFCGKQPIINTRTPLCSKHFCQSLEKTIQYTIQKFQMFTQKDKIAVACSGGKDSMTLLYILNKLKFNVTAIAIDEGIETYRTFTLKFLEQFCKKHNIPYKKNSFKNHTGLTMDEVIKKSKISPCRICGTWRRYLLGKTTKNYDVLATGHNLDDEAQTIIMNIINCNFNFMNRIGPTTHKNPKNNFPKKVKPPYFCHEKEIATYAYTKKILTKFNECPNFQGSFRNFITETINNLENKTKGFKKNLIQTFLKQKNPTTQPTTTNCTTCGEISSKKTCSSCTFIETLIVN